MTLFLVHTLILLWLSLASAHRLLRAWPERLLATALLGWGNLVATSLLLSCLRHLGEPAWFFRTSLMLAGATWLLLRRGQPEPAPVIPTDSAEGKPGQLLLAAFVVTLIPIVYASVRIAATYEPNNYDSLAYHLPRAMYYMGQNTLAHFDTGNPRQIYFPLNYNLLQLAGLIYSPPLQSVNFINLAAWAVAGLAVYRLCRLCACSANAALVASWLALTSTQVLAQATATTNDLPVGAGLLCTLVFALRWRQSRQTRDALLAGLAAGLTAGSKLTVIFFGPAAGLIVLVLAWQHWRRGEVRPFFHGVRAWLVPGLLALTLASPFALVNLAEKGEWINKTYDFTLNRPFSLACAGQTAGAYLVQLFLEPLHRFTFDLQFTERLNEWGRQTLFPHWNEAFAFSPFYLFPPDLNEDHVWFGFTGPFILLCAGFCLVRYRHRPAPMLWLAALGLGWFATYFLLNKWSLYNQRYFVPAILVLSPCMAAVVEASWNSAALRRSTRNGVVMLALCSLWLCAVYLFYNTSRPYAPLWAGQPPPPALPELPSPMAQRLAEQPRVNIFSTDGNERIFLLMTAGRRQRFTSFEDPVPGAYNVFSHWGFVRKVAYSNIEQLSSFTVVEVPTKRTAGVEFLGTINSGQPALDYYGLPPHPELAAPTPDNRKVLVTFYYAPRDPNRYMFLRIKVAGLNVPDHARLTVGVEYQDHSTETLATFTATGEARASVTKPFRRFTVRVADQDSGVPIGAVDLPYLVRDDPPDVEAPQNALSLFSDELIATEPRTKIVSEGLGNLEGPYARGNLPFFRWAKAPVVRLNVPADQRLGLLRVTFSARLHVHDIGGLDVLINGRLAQHYQLEGSATWLGVSLDLPAATGDNVIEFRSVALGSAPDWLDYLERYPDVKNYLVAQNIPLEPGAREHWELKGKAENRTLHRQRLNVPVESPNNFYYLFRHLRVEGLRVP